MMILICREFNANEEWLNTGRGEMFKSRPEYDEVALYAAELLEDDGTNPLYAMIKEVIHTYMELDPKSQEVINNTCKKFIENINANKKEG
jgi:hypothetical protein